MSVIVVANPKGGVGKSTLATQISGFLASQGKLVTLGDLDRQQSSRQWLDIRPPTCGASCRGRSRATRSPAPPRARPTPSSTRPPACTAPAWTPR